MQQSYILLLLPSVLAIDGRWSAGRRQAGRRAGQGTAGPPLQSADKHWPNGGYDRIYQQCLHHREFKVTVCGPCPGFWRRTTGLSVRFLQPCPIKLYFHEVRLKGLGLRGLWCSQNTRQFISLEGLGPGPAAALRWAWKYSTPGGLATSVSNFWNVLFNLSIHWTVQQGSGSLAFFCYLWATESYGPAF